MKIVTNTTKIIIHHYDDIDDQLFHEWCHIYLHALKSYSPYVKKILKFDNTYSKIFTRHNK